MKHLALIWLLGLAACGRGDGDIDEYIGQDCASDRDCESRCFMGGDFPGGFCSVSCVSDNDCPDDAYCMSESGGVCMFYCPEFDCSRLGAGWSCKDKGRKNGGDANVCSG